MKKLLLTGAIIAALTPQANAEYSIFSGAIFPWCNSYGIDFQDTIYSWKYQDNFTKEQAIKMGKYLVGDEPLYQSILVESIERSNWDSNWGWMSFIELSNLCDKMHSEYILN